MSEGSCWGDYSRIYAEATYSVDADTPLRVEYIPQISQMYTDFSGEGFLTQILYLIKICVNLWNLWDKKHHEEKSVEYVEYYLQEIFSNISSISLGIP